MRHKTKKKGMDYNADIPFEKKPAAGFYDTSDEQARIAAAPVGQTLRRLENKRKPEEEEAERKKRQKRGKEGEGNGPHQTKFIAARDAQIQKLKEAESIGRRGKLVLPAAQVGEAELEEIVKIGQASENARALVGGADDPSGQLLGEYDSLERAKMARTPRTAPQQDNIMMEARNLRNMTIAQTPLLGDENTPLHVRADGGTGFEGATPRHQAAFTPNPLATPRNGDVAATPRTGATPMRTPMRDSLSINPEDRSSFVGDTPRELRMRANSAKRSLQASFMNLPKPENNFELLVPDDEEEEGPSAPALSEEDAAERDARLRRKREEEEQAALARRSQVVQRGLPRPPNVDIERLLQDLKLSGSETVSEEAQRLVDLELARLVHHDSIAHPLPGTVYPGGTQSSYEPPPDAYVAAARAEVERELAGVLGFPDAPAEQLKEGIVALSKGEVVDESASWASVRPTLAFDAGSGAWVPAEELDAEGRAAGYAALLEESRATMAREAARAAKVEKKLGITLGGYIARAKDLSGKVTSAFDGLAETAVDLESFGRLRAVENAMGPVRVSALREEVEKLEGRERMLQSVYGELEREKRELEGRVGELEERLMAEAEALNEMALAEESA
ncbi:hypothetical protein BV25DRAFT_1825641 [Artomyces pyxidatus]|uniref:Uncharacterized protein n=1 Tax=Artomyces pyxidatus TaxID=48021 RepID=A0ACB8T2H2_9AGAM|nr:hypothetical protein BV25DRAFT_1825641 [Artomyces pyxidatus]